MNSEMPDTNTPDMRVGDTRIQTVRSGEGVFGKFVFARFDVNSDNPAFIARFDARANVALIERLTA